MKLGKEDEVRGPELGRFSLIQCYTYPYTRTTRQRLYMPLALTHAAVMGGGTWADITAHVCMATMALLTHGNGWSLFSLMVN